MINCLFSSVSAEKAISVVSFRVGVRASQYKQVTIGVMGTF